MKNARVERSRQLVHQHIPYEKSVEARRDYFNEALRILDNDITLIPQREHLTALWGLVIGLSRRLTEAHVQCRHHRSAALVNNRRTPKQRKASPRPPFPAGVGLMRHGRNFLPLSG